VNFMSGEGAIVKHKNRMKFEPKEKLKQHL